MEGVSADWLTELALHEGWIRSPDDIWDDRPRIGRARYRGRVGERVTDADLVWEPPADLGLTFTRIFGLLDAYADRKRRELHEEGTVAAIAAHDPKGLKQLDQPPARQEGRVPDRIGDYRRKRGIH